MTPYYADDAVTIYHGDAREITLEADVLVADPPYGVAFDHTRRVGSTPRTFAQGGVRRGVEWPAVVGDGAPFDPTPWLGFRSVVLWGANHYADRLPPASRWLVWDKREGTTSDTGADCEMAWTNLPGQARLYSQLWRGMLRRGEENGQPRVHPTQKPVALMEWVIQLCPPGVVLDPFMGSGSTLVAAKRLGRRAIGIEIEERYCEAAALRCSQDTLGLSFLPDSAAFAAAKLEPVAE